MSLRRGSENTRRFWRLIGPKWLFVGTGAAADRGVHVGAPGFPFAHRRYPCMFAQWTWSLLDTYPVRQGTRRVAPIDPGRAIPTPKLAPCALECASVF
jgi:hypothetical protein